MFTPSILSLALLAGVLEPAKQWFAPPQPVTIKVQADAPVRLVLVEFNGVLNPGRPEVDASQDVDLRKTFDGLRTGTYVLFAVPKTAPADANPATTFTGTPLIVQFRGDKRTGAPAGPVVVRVEPLRFAKIDTTQGEMTAAFYYDVAPNTVNSFLTLSEQGYYDGLHFHRIIKDFVVQGGDPLGHDPARAGQGGPGYMIDAEFSDRRHEKGVLSMARQGDPLEQQGMMPRSEAANSAGSQFFICLNYERTKALDDRYTVFGRIVKGLDVVDKLGTVATGPGDRPTEDQIIKKVTVEKVTPENNPYVELLTPIKPDDAPAGR